MEEMSLTTVPIEAINRDLPAAPDKRRIESLRRLGQKSPVVLEFDGTVYRIVAGNRRVADLEAMGKTEVTALVVPASGDSFDHLIHALALNLSRSFNPMHEALLIEQLLALKDDNGRRRYSQTDIAGFLGVSQGVIAQRVSLLRLIPELRTKVALGEMTIKAARTAQKLTKAEQEKLLAGQNLTIDAVNEALRQEQAGIVDLSSIDTPAVPVLPGVFIEPGKLAALAMDRQPVEFEWNGLKFRVEIEEE